MRGKPEELVPFFKAEAPDLFGALCNEHMDWLRVRGYSESSIRSRTVIIGYFMTWCSERGILRPVEVTPPIIDRYQRHLFYHRKRDGKALTFASQSSRLSTLRSFFKWLARKHYIPYNPASELELPKRGRSLPKAILTEKEVELVMSLPDISTPFGIRDRAILELFYSSGIRRMEMVNLKVSDLDLDQRNIMIREGKGKKDRVTPLGKRAALWVEKYLYDARPHLITGLDEGLLFLNYTGQPIGREGMTRQVSCYIKAADIGKSGGCHIFRHTMATHMLENGADVRFVQEMLGHARIETTQIYTHVSIKKLKEIHARTHPSELSLREFEREATVGAVPSEIILVKPPEVPVEENSPHLLATVIETYLREKRALLVGRSAEQIEFRLARLLKWYGPLATEKVNEALLNEYATRRKAEGVAQSTINIEFLTFNDLLRFAKERGHCENPPIRLNLRAKPAAKYISRTDFEKVLSHLEYPYVRLYFSFQRHMGLRKLEAAKMKHHWINESRGTLRVEAEKGARILKIPKALLSEYQSLPRISEWVCPGPRNPSAAVVKPVFMVKRACLLAEVPFFFPDDLRHSFSQDLAEKGVKGPIRKAILGLSVNIEDEESQAREKAMAEAMDLEFGPLPIGKKV